MTVPAVDLKALYAKHAARFDSLRSGSAIEVPYLERVAELADSGSSVLDVGCGSGEPIARYFIERDYHVTGVDFTEEMVAIARSRFPASTWMCADMRELELDQQFDIVIAWDSLFHLSPADQRETLPRLREHLRPGGVLLFTSGTEESVAVGGTLFGDQLFHGSLSTAEYREILEGLGIDVVLHRVKDPDCGGRTVWVGQRTS